MRRRVRRHEKNLPVVESDVGLRRRLVAGIEQRRDARRRRRAGPLQAFVACVHDALSAGSDWISDSVWRIRLARGRAERRVDLFKKRNQIRRLRELAG